MHTARLNESYCALRRRRKLKWVNRATAAKPQARPRTQDEVILGRHRTYATRQVSREPGALPAEAFHTSAKLASRAGKGHKSLDGSHSDARRVTCLGSMRIYAGLILTTFVKFLT